MKRVGTYREDVGERLGRVAAFGAGGERSDVRRGLGDEGVDLVNDGLHIRGGGIVSRKSSCERTTSSATVHGERKSIMLTELGRDGRDGRGERVEDVDGGRARLTLSGNSRGNRAECDERKGGDLAEREHCGSSRGREV